MIDARGFGEAVDEDRQADHTEKRDDPDLLELGAFSTFDSKRIVAFGTLRAHHAGAAFHAAVASFETSLTAAFG